MKCPKCGLHNPPSAMKCDCGYEFPNVGDNSHEDKVEVTCPTCGRRLRVPFLAGRTLRVNCPNGCPSFSTSVPSDSEEEQQEVAGNMSRVSPSRSLWSPNVIQRLVLAIGLIGVVFMIAVPPYCVVSPIPVDLGIEKRFFYKYAPIYRPPEIDIADARMVRNTQMFASVELDGQRLGFQILAGILTTSAVYLAVPLAQASLAVWHKSKSRKKA